MTPIAHFSRRYHFSASHRLFVASMSEAQNLETFGKCANPFGHGHNYTLEVTVAGPVDAVTGMVVDMVKLDALVQQKVLDRWDHTSLNQDPLFAGALVPSTENVTFEVEKLLKQGISELATAQQTPLELVRIRMEETSNNAFDLLVERDAAAATIF